MCPGGSRWRASLRGLPTPSVVLCAEGIRSTLLCFRPLGFAPGSSKVAVAFFGLFVSFVRNLPQLRMRAVIFSPIQFLCILLLQERCVQVQALQRCSKGAQVPTCLNSTSFKALLVLSDLFWPHLKGTESLRKVLIQLPDPECRAPSPTQGSSHSGCFQALSNENDTVVNILIHTSLHICVSSPVR